MKTYRVVSITYEFGENFAIVVTDDDGSERQSSITFRRRDLAEATQKHLEQQERQASGRAGTFPAKGS
jgi:hypothetical protein